MGRIAARSEVLGRTIVTRAALGGRQVLSAVVADRVSLSLSLSVLKINIENSRCASCYTNQSLESKLSDLHLST